ncbi:TPA: DUF2591 domain-containing protein [Escherichia coli]|nr:DUF2591 domain-containing protein [Escherichia coli]HDW9078048.1 DUF2591 domain-containing protein [Escherichia coli]HDW9141632.1 DUF2591 domain-containing protein [Escherichia coli]
MDYSQLSDFEINKRVAICCGFAPEDCEIAKLGTSIVGVEWDDETGYAIKTVDYCKSPADAWPVIAKHQISICAYERNNPGMKNEYWWEADRFCEFITIDNNPLRAAMIVFLMMQENQNG